MRLRFRPAMHDRIAGLPFERQLRILSPHPHIEPLMQKQIRQQGADDGLNAKDNFQFDRAVRYRQEGKKR